MLASQVGSPGFRTKWTGHHGSRKVEEFGGQCRMHRLCLKMKKKGGMEEENRSISLAQILFTWSRYLEVGRRYKVLLKRSIFILSDCRSSLFCQNILNSGINKKK